MAEYCSKKAAKITLWISTFVLIFSIAMVFVFGAMYNKLLKKDITLSNGTLVTNIWKDIPIPIYEKLYFFNVTNGKAFVDGTEPLKVSEIGPYTYKSRWVKENLQWNTNNTVSYREVRTYNFVPEMSVGSEEDLVYTLNGPLVIAAYKAKSWPTVLDFIISKYLEHRGEDFITKKSIKELTYSGYKDMIIDWASEFIKDLPYKEGKFSWLYGKNGTDDGLFTVFTGSDDASKTNFINNLNGKERLNFWEGDTCNMLNGTSIETGPPIHGYQESYTFFQSLICRSLTFQYTHDETHFGINSKRFKSTYDLFANASENPDNYCFNVNGERRSGVLDVSPCQFGAPVYMSFPHFYFADPFYQNFVNGLNPIKEKHESYVDVEPETGFSIDIAIRLQINVEISKISGFSQLSKVKEGIYPVFWVELLASIDEDLSDFLKSKVRMPKIIAYSVIGVLGTVSLLLIAVSIIVLCEPEGRIDTQPLIGSSKSAERQEKGYDNKICSSYSSEKEVNSNEAYEKDNKPTGYHGAEDIPGSYNKTESTPPNYSEAMLAVRRRSSPTLTTIQVKH